MGEMMTQPETMTLAPPRSVGDTAALAAPAIALAALAALVALVLVPAGWRAGLWQYRVSLGLFQYSAYIAAVALLAGLVALGGWKRFAVARRAVIIVTLVAAAAMVYWPWHYTRLAAVTPPIHDITTDTADPPLFWATLPSRAAENASSVEYGGPAVAKLQREAYPDIRPVETNLPPRVAYAVALSVAQTIPGWIDVIAEPSARRIEASQQSFWMHLTDDISIRVASTGKGSRIDVRSLSRQGVADFGVNADRIRAYTAALRAALTAKANAG